jgi:hypothetical protein
MINNEKIKAMLIELDKIYNDIDKLKLDMSIIKIKWEELHERKDTLQNLIMYSSNKLDRQNKYNLLENGK